MTRHEKLFTLVEIGNELIGEILKYLVGANVVERLRLVHKLAAQRTTVLCCQVSHQTTATNCNTHITHTRVTCHRDMLIKHQYALFCCYTTL